MNDPDTWIGSIMVAGGSTGITLQVVMGYVSLGVIGLNLLLALGGGYLLYLRIKRARASLRDSQKDVPS